MDQNKNDPAQQLEGYDPSQRAEILEAESVNQQGYDLIEDLTPDRGQSVTQPVPPEDQLHDDTGARSDAGTQALGDVAAESPDGGPGAQAADEKLTKGEVDVGLDGGGGISVLGKSEDKTEKKGNR